MTSISIFEVACGPSRRDSKSCEHTVSSARSPAVRSYLLSGGRPSSCATCSTAAAHSARSGRAPGIPTALLAKRLDGLEQAGIVVRRAKHGGRGASYELSEMGRALQPVLNALGQWGARWLEIEPRHLDASYVLWATMKLVDHDRIPDGTTTVRFDIAGASGHYWMLLRRPQSELCTRSNGYIEDLVCATSAGTLVDLHLRRITYAQA